jgi:hypothetical protein
VDGLRRSDVDVDRGSTALTPLSAQDQLGERLDFDELSRVADGEGDDARSCLDAMGESDSMQG